MFSLMTDEVIWVRYRKVFHETEREREREEPRTSLSNHNESKERSELESSECIMIPNIQCIIP